MFNDLLVFDCGYVSFLLLLDLSSAFDIIDLGILLSRLENKLCVGRQVPAWFRSYLTDKCQFVQIRQGSDLGFLIFPLDM